MPTLTTTKLLKNPKLSKLIKHFGTEHALADALNINVCSLYHWNTRKKIPAIHAISLEKLTKGKFSINWLLK